LIVAVAEQSGSSAGRRAQRKLVHVSPGKAAQGKSEERYVFAKRRTARVDLGLSDRGRGSRAGSRRNFERDERMEDGDERVGGELHGFEGGWKHDVRLLDLHRRFSERGAEPSERARLERFLRAWMGMGVAGGSACTLQPSVSEAG